MCNRINFCQLDLNYKYCYYWLQCNIQLSFLLPYFRKSRQNQHLPKLIEEVGPTIRSGWIIYDIGMNQLLESTPNSWTYLEVVKREELAEQLAMGFQKKITSVLSSKKVRANKSSERVYCAKNSHGTFYRSLLDAARR